MPEQFSSDPDSRQLSQPDSAAKRSHKAAPLPKLSQQSRFPVSFYVVHHLPTNSYGSVIVGRTRGLACFTKPEFALTFSATMETRDNLVVEIYMEDASEIASASTPRSGALILADYLDTPVVYRLKGRNRHV
jgi:hypothetical protein